VSIDEKKNRKEEEVKVKNKQYTKRKEDQEEISKIRNKIGTR